MICISQVNLYCFTHHVYDDTLDEPEERYEDKYPLDNAKCSDDPIRVVNPSSYIMDYTPNGIIVLRYDYDSEAFFYWSNKKNIPYKVLETAARKYITTYCCKELYIDKEQLLKEKKELYEEKQKQLKEQEEMKKEDTRENDDSDSENSVFATLKDLSLIHI